MKIVPTKPVVVVASGSGSGFEKLVENESASAAIGCPYKVTALVVTKPGCGAIDRANSLDVPCRTWVRNPGGNWLADDMCELTSRFGARLPVMLSGCNVRIEGFRPGEAINIHPAPTHLINGKRPFAGKGMYGLAPHKAVLQAGCKTTGVTIHEVTDGLDEGRVLDFTEVPVHRGDTPEVLQRRVNKVEHDVQWEVMARWLHGRYD